MMKRFLLLLAFCTGVISHAAERVYVCTDRNIYIAGDRIWCSLYCLDGMTQNLSRLSSAAYVELASAQGVVCTAKISLIDGCGAGAFNIPADAPTGNYVLLAYTRVSGAEGCLDGARILSVFNTSSTARVNGGVEIVDNSLYNSPTYADETCGISISSSGSHACGASFTINVNSPSDATISLSVYKTDNILPPTANDIISFYSNVVKDKSASQPGKGTIEYEGEIIHGTIKGERTRLSTISSAGSPSDFYIGRADGNGNVYFYTNNIFGDRELVCSTADKGSYLTIEEPFIHPEPGNIPALAIAQSAYTSLVSRKAAAASMARIPADTLETNLPRRKDILLEGCSYKNYHLDDYTRFTSLKEIIVEITKELSIVTVRGEEVLKLRERDKNTGQTFSSDNLLTMIDGVLINGIAQIKRLDAMLLSDVEIYSGSIMIGGLVYGGAVNFITKENYVEALDFPSNVRVVDFKGFCFPTAYTGAVPQGQDNRYLLYWHPIMHLRGGNTSRIRVTAPSSPGKYTVAAEGFDATGHPLRSVYYIDVK